MTPQGRAFAISRLDQAPTLSALAAVWDTFGIDARRDPQVWQAKEDMKAALSKEGAK